MALNWLREQMKYLGWLLVVVSAALIITLFYDFGAVNPAAGGGPTDTAAWVGEEEITFAEFGRAYRNLESRYRQMFGQQWSEEMAEQFNLPKQALDQLVSQRILLLEAERVGLRATDPEVQKMIRELFEDENGKFVGRERVQQILRSNRLSEREFAEDVRRDVLLQKLNAVLAQTLYVTDAEVEEAYRTEAEKAEIRWIQLPATEIADVEVTDEDVASYFAENESDYLLPEQRRADYLLVDTVEMRREVGESIGDEELRAYFEDNSKEFERDEQVRARHILLRTTPSRDADAARAELEAARQRLEGGEDFATLAEELSDDEGSAQRGGDLGYFGRGTMVEPFEDAVFAARPGELVGPVETDFGVHLIRVEDVREGGVPPFEELQPMLRSRLVGERVNELAQAKIDAIAAKLDEKENPTAEDLRALAEEEGAKYESAEPFGQGDTVPGVGRVAAFTDAAFGLETGHISEPIKVPRGFTIVHLAEVLPPRIPELDEVRAQVRQDAETEKRRQAARERLAAVREQIAAGETTLDAAADELALEVQESAEFGRDGSLPGLGRSRDVIDAALSLDEGALSEPIATAQGAVLFEVTGRKTFDDAEFEERRAELREQVAGERLQQLLSSIIEQRQRDLRVKFDPRVTQDFDIQS